MNSWENVLDPNCTKFEALELIRQDFERGYYPSAHDKALECLKRKFLLSAHDKMHLSVAIHAGGESMRDFAQAKLLWDDGRERLWKKRDAQSIVTFGFLLASAYHMKRDAPRMFDALFAVRSYVTPADLLEYNQMVENYELLSNNRERADQLLVD